MKRAVTLFAVIAALGLVFAGCKKKPADKKEGDDKMMAAAMDDMMEADMMEADMMEADMMEAMMEAAGGGDGDKVGVPECDAYIKAMRCYLSKLPAAARGPSKAAFEKSIASFKKMAKGPAKAQVAKGCKMTMDAWKKSIAKNPKFADCLK